MKNFEYKNTAPKLFTVEIINLISAIHEYKGKQDLLIKTNPDILSHLIDIAKIQSIDSSNKLEDITISELRLKEIVQKKSAPLTRNEKEIAGYHDVLTTIYDNYDYITPRSNAILQIHRDLYSHTSSSIGGKYKNTDNLIQRINSNGEKKVHFKPLSTTETPEAMEKLCDTFIEEIKKGDFDPLLLIPMFILDFLCIHPFNDGNGRISRLLTLLLLDRSGYIVGKYISLEMLIEKTKETYYDVFHNSSKCWHEDKNDYIDFVEYYLTIILEAYKQFTNRTEILNKKSLNKTERIQIAIENKLGKITKKEILDLCPDISQTTVEKVLNDLIKQGTILKIGGGRYTQYIFNRD